MKQAVFILGPESSGTRMLTQAFIHLGFYGDAGHKQRLDAQPFSETPNKIVFRRSLPHGKTFPKVAASCLAMLDAGYAVTPVLIVRDKDITAESQVRNGWVASIERAYEQIRHSVDHVYLELAEVKLFPVVLHYEPFVLHAQVRELFFAEFDLDVPQMEFVDGNAKYRKG